MMMRKAGDAHTHNYIETISKNTVDVDRSSITGTIDVCSVSRNTLDTFKSAERCGKRENGFGFLSIMVERRVD
jgi:hypothetical protein